MAVNTRHHSRCTVRPEEHEQLDQQQRRHDVKANECVSVGADGRSSARARASPDRADPLPGAPFIPSLTFVLHSDFVVRHIVIELIEEYDDHDPDVRDGQRLLLQRRHEPRRHGDSVGGCGCSGRMRTEGRLAAAVVPLDSNSVGAY